MSRRLQTIQHSEDRAHEEEIARLNKEAGEARKTAGEAHERASKAEENLAGANERAAAAELHAAEASKKAEEFRLAIADAQVRAAQANLELARFRAPRSISTEEQQTISKALEVFAGTPFDLSVSADAESVELMKTIRSMLSSAKWVQVPAKGVIGFGTVTPLVAISMSEGVALEIDATRNSEWGPAALSLMNILQVQGISTRANAFDAAKGDSVSPNAIHIVGSKPKN